MVGGSLRSACKGTQGATQANSDHPIVRPVGATMFKAISGKAAAGPPFQAMNGRKFGGNTVVADFLDERKFDEGSIE